MKPNEVSHSLYSLASELRQLFDDLADSGGEFTDNQELAMHTATGLISQKTDGVVAWVQSQEDLISLADQKIKDLQEFKKAILGRLDRFDGYVNNCLSLMQTNKIEGQLYAIKKRKPSKVVVITDESALPMDFIKIPEPKAEVMKSEIAKALKAGQEVPGASLQDSQSVSIQYGLK